jgi:hypothetical protein
VVSSVCNPGDPDSNLSPQSLLLLGEYSLHLAYIHAFLWWGPLDVYCPCVTRLQSCVARGGERGRGSGGGPRFLRTLLVRRLPKLGVGAGLAFIQGSYFALS